MAGRELAVCWRTGMLFVVTYSMLAVTVLLLKIITLLFKSLVAGVVLFCFVLLLLLKKCWRGGTGPPLRCGLNRENSKTKKWVQEIRGKKCEFIVSFSFILFYFLCFFSFIFFLLNVASQDRQGIARNTTITFPNACQFRYALLQVRRA